MTDFPPPDDHESEASPGSETDHIADPEPETIADPAFDLEDWSGELPDPSPDEAATDVEPDTAADDFSDDDLLAAASVAGGFEPAASASDPHGDGTADGPHAGPTTAPPPPYGADPAPPHGVQPPSRRLYRSAHDRKLGGVAAGVAEYFRIDPTIVRVLTALLALTGVGFFIYLAAWFIIPSRPAGFMDPPHTRPAANERTMSIVFGIAALAIAFGIVTDSWEALALALIGGGIWLLSERTMVRPGLVPAGPSNTGHQAAAAPFDPEGLRPYEPMPYAQAPANPYRDAGYSPAAGLPYPPAPAHSAAPVPAAPRKPQRITWIVLSLLALLASVGIAAASGDWWDVSATRFLGIGVIIIGIGVVVGQLRGGGARGLIPLGILAAILLFPVSAVDGLLDDGVGSATYRPTTLAELADNYDHGIGELVVDLSRLDFDGRAETIDIDLGIGELIVIVSEDTGGQAVLQATAGEVKHFLPQTDSLLFEEGVNIETGTVSLEGENGTLDLNINVGFGTAELRSESN